MSNRDRLIRRYGNAAKQREAQPFVALLGAETDGTFSATVNGRALPRPAVASNEFAFGAQGSKEGDHVILITAEANDMPVIIGLSPWII
jgi:hypothetical protein